MQMGREMGVCWDWNQLGNLSENQGAPGFGGVKSVGELAGMCGALDEHVERSLGRRGRERLGHCGEPEVCAWRELWE